MPSDSRAAIQSLVRESRDSRSLCVSASRRIRALASTQTPAQQARPQTKDEQLSAPPFVSSRDLLVELVRVACDAGKLARPSDPRLGRTKIGFTTEMARLGDDPLRLRGSKSRAIGLSKPSQVCSRKTR
jgi:hypothetical protein